MFTYRLYDVRTPRRIVFRIATSTTSMAENVFLRLEWEGVVGWGAACINTVTQETFESIHRDLPLIVEAANEMLANSGDRHPISDDEIGSLSPNSRPLSPN